MALEAFKSHPDITHNSVNYIHGNGDYLLAATISGVDRYKISTGDREHVLAEHVSKCYQTSIGDYYYAVNPLFDVSRITGEHALDGHIFDWDYVRTIDISIPTSEDDYQFYFEVTISGSEENIYGQAAEEGADIRILDDKGMSRPYYIEKWDYINPPQIWVQLDKGTSRLYMLCGNDSASAQSDPNEVFRFFDDFDDPELSDEWIWEVENNYSDNYYIISDSIFKFDLNHGSFDCFLTSVNSFPSGVIEYYGRGPYDSPDYADAVEWRVGFTDGVHSQIGTDEADVAHRLISNTTVVGTKYLSLDFHKHTIVESENIQLSTYNGETLTTSGVYLTGNKTLSFFARGHALCPDIEMDWVRVRSYDENQPTYVVSDSINVDNLCGVVELNSVCEGGYNYKYVSQKDSVLDVAHINDLHVTENTSIYGGNVIFLATLHGAYVVEERRGDEENCRKKIYLIET